MYAQKWGGWRQNKSFQVYNEAYERTFLTRKDNANSSLNRNHLWISKRRRESNEQERKNCIKCHCNFQHYILFILKSIQLAYKQAHMPSPVPKTPHLFYFYLSSSTLRKFSILGCIEGSQLLDHHINSHPSLGILSFCFSEN